MRPEGSGACRAPPALHGCVSAHKKRRAWATQSVDDNHADVHPDGAGRKQVSGSIPMSKAGSMVVSTEELRIKWLPRGNKLTPLLPANVSPEHMSKQPSMWP
jgi:hypothetical protein